MNVSKEEFRKRIMMEMELRAEERAAAKKRDILLKRDISDDLYSRRKAVYVKKKWRMSVM